MSAVISCMNIKGFPRRGVVLNSLPGIAVDGTLEAVIFLHLIGKSYANKKME